LVVAWNEEQYKKLPEVLQDNINAGDLEARLLTREELLHIEPSLSKHAMGAVYLPREAIVEPWLVVIGYALNCLLHNVNIHTKRKVGDIKYNNITKQWKIITHQSNDKSSGRSIKGTIINSNTTSNNNINNSDHVIDDNSREYHANVIINCAGLFGDEIEKLRLSNTSFSNNQINANNHNTDNNNHVDNSNLLYLLLYLLLHLLPMLMLLDSLSLQHLINNPNQPMEAAITLRIGVYE
jgi:L-2-hydroxyglutarate oxidase LhgO